MSAIAADRAASSPEDAFAQVRRSGPARRSTPRIRLVTAPATAPVPRAPGPGHAVPPTLATRVSVLRARDGEAVLDDEVRPVVPAADPAAVGCSIALAALEVLAGRRPVAQLARWLAPGVYDALQVRSGLTARVLRTPRGVRRPVVRRFRATAVVATVHEVSVVADDAGRVRAVAMRLEAHRGAWRATALEIG